MNGLRFALALARAAVAFGSRRMPLGSPWACTAGTVLFLFGGFWLVPRVALVARRAPLFEQAIRGEPRAAAGLRFMTLTLEGAALFGAWLFQARCLWLCLPEAFGREASPPGRRGPRAPLKLAGLPIGEGDLTTSILVTGVTGSSKTAGLLLPALKQLLEAYRGGKGGREKLGAFIPEVKGDLVEATVYLAHQAGRCVCRDVLILSPASRLPVVRYRDEAGRRWFLSGRGGTGGSDAGDLLPPMVFPAGHRAAGASVPQDVFEEPGDCLAALPEWSRIARPVSGLPLRYVGWRWRGGELVRISRTARRDDPDPMAGPDGRPIRAAPPETLTAEGVEYVDSGVHYNLIDARIPAAEAAERLTRLVAMARGAAPRGENDYFYDQGRKLIAACLSLHRATAAEPATAADVARLATRDDRLEAALVRLEAIIADGDNPPSAPESDEAEESRRRSLPALRELAAFFREEWQRMVADGRTANVIKATISAALDPFLHDANLAETFCRPSTFSFEEAAQRGRIVALVPGDRYEQVGRLLGTACKLDFQSVMLARTSRPDLNRTRLVLYVADECHKYAAGGSASAGDPYFMNLSRSNRVANVCATQSYAWLVEVLGREAANVYISAFGVQFWLQQTDPETCRRAAEICGTFTRETHSAEHELDFGGLVAALATGRDLTIRHRSQEERMPRFRPEDFALLDVGEAIGYNKGRPGRLGKVARGRVSYLECTRPPAGPERIRARMREYYREILENLAYERGEVNRWDAGPGAESGGRKRGRVELAEYIGPPVGASDEAAELAAAEWAGEAGISSDESENP
ncbi:MAG: TraM recognition domain-containing protein [Opitutaceae bacterium]